ncbi:MULTISPECIES: hypothetical protein [Gammaproteobacteria]|uniref:hypothetical protein n=1 Tax=Gammaproteobacteria TaxID=1236 RepID=UPI000DCFDD30|nr:MULTISPECIES: hypothetical protein [Gammaproteobacteria]RTE86712.1 hypothetical protein DQX04_09185 [Aliidiomarina sp. B3213]TCZ90734.1 hypothetical protein EYQ95_07860 [Lysobacter sp. N42]
MKKLVLLGTALLALSSLPSFAKTSSNEVAEAKKFTVSVGSYARTFSNSNTDESFVGFAVSGMGVFAESERFDFAGHAVATFLENENLSALESNDFEMNALIGQNLTGLGFKWYAGAGFFNDSWEFSGGSLDFSGPQLAGGVGYNTEKVSFDLFINIRSESSYDDIPNIDSVASAMFSIGLRF